MDKITVSDLNLYYGQFQALKHINAAFPEKEITALIGPSGCGKSTLLKSLNRMNDLVEGCRITGSVQLDGEELYGGMDVNVLRKRVGMVFQKPNPFPMSIYDNIRKLVLYALRTSRFEAQGFDRPSAFWPAMAQQLPSLVLLDIMLPEEDGLSVLHRLRVAPGAGGGKTAGGGVGSGRQRRGHGQRTGAGRDDL